MALRRSLAVFVGSAALLVGVTGVSSGAPSVPPKWEAVACRNHVYAKVQECKTDLKKRGGYVIEAEEKHGHWEVEHAYSTKAAASTEVKWLKAHKRKNALVEAEE